MFWIWNRMTNLAFYPFLSQGFAVFHAKGRIPRFILNYASLPQDKIQMKSETLGEEHKLLWTKKCMSASIASH